MAIDLERLAAQRHRFLEPIVRSGQIARHPVGIAEARVDLQRSRGFLLKIAVSIFDVCDRPAQRQRIEAEGVDGLRPRNGRFRGSAIALAEMNLGHQQVSRHDVRVERERLLNRLGGRRRVDVQQRLTHSEERRNPFVVCPERILERFRGLGVVVDLQEQFTPTRVNRGVVWGFLCRNPVRIIGELKVAERTGRTAQPCVLGGGRTRSGLHVGDALQQRARRVAPPHHVVEEAELQRRLSFGRAFGGGPEQGFCVGVAANIDRSARLDDNGIGSALGVRYPTRPAVRDRADGQ